MKTRIVALFVIALGIAAIVRSVAAQEVATLATPITRTATTCTVDTMLLDVTRGRIVVALLCPGGDPITKTYDSFTTPTGATLLHSLNVGNFSATSLIKAVYTRLITDGVITGTVSGVAQ